MELNADANPGRTGADDGTPEAAAAAAATACSGATGATEDGVAPGSPMNEDRTGLPPPCPPDTPRPGKAVGPAPGGRPGKMEGAEVRPRPKGEAALGAALGARPWYMEVGGGLEMLPVAGMVEGGSEDEREGKPGSPA